MTCLKCKAPASALEPLREFLGDGTELQVVRCLMCGERRSRVVNRYSDISLSRCGSRYTRSIPMSQCQVLGCGGEISAHNKSRFCGRCSNRQNKWLKGHRTTPPPLIKVAGSWIENPERAEVTHA